MTTIAYLRVSKNSQDVKNQRLAILEFAHGKKLEVDEFMEVSVSSRRSAKDRKLDLLICSLLFANRRDNGCACAPGSSPTSPEVRLMVGPQFESPAPSCEHTGSATCRLLS